MHITESHFEYANSIIKIFGYDNLADYSTQISYSDIVANTAQICIEINKTMPTFKKLFDLKKFDLKRINYTLATSDQVFSFLKKLLSVLFIPFDVVRLKGKIWLRLVDQKNIYYRFIRKMADLGQTQPVNAPVPLASGKEQEQANQQEHQQEHQQANQQEHQQANQQANQQEKQQEQQQEQPKANHLESNHVACIKPTEIEYVKFSDIVKKHRGHEQTITYEFAHDNDFVFRGTSFGLDVVTEIMIKLYDGSTPINRVISLGIDGSKIYSKNVHLSCDPIIFYNQMFPITLSPYSNIVLTICYDGSLRLLQTDTFVVVSFKGFNYVQSINPLTQSINPLTQSINPLTQSINPLTQSINPLTQSINPLTPKLKQSYKRIHIDTIEHTHKIIIDNGKFGSMYSDTNPLNLPDRSMLSNTFQMMIDMIDDFKNKQKMHIFKDNIYGHDICIYRFDNTTDDLDKWYNDTGGSLMLELLLLVEMEKRETAKPSYPNVVDTGIEINTWRMQKHSSMQILDNNMALIKYSFNRVSDLIRRIEILDKSIDYDIYINDQKIDAGKPVIYASDLNMLALAYSYHHLNIIVPFEKRHDWLTINTKQIWCFMTGNIRRKISTLQLLES